MIGNTSIAHTAAYLLVVKDHQCMNFTRIKFNFSPFRPSHLEVIKVLDLGLLKKIKEVLNDSKTRFLKNILIALKLNWVSQFELTGWEKALSVLCKNI